VISTVGRGEDGASFGSINERRKLALATFDWPAVCGFPFGDAPRCQVLMAPARHYLMVGWMGNCCLGDTPVPGLLREETHLADLLHHLAEMDDPSL